MRNELKTIAEISQVIRGVSYQKAESSDFQRENTIPIIRAGNIQNRLNLEKDLVWVPTSKVKSFQKLKQNDIVMCTSSGSINVVGKSAKALDDWNGSFGAFCIGIRSNTKLCNPSYLFFYLNSPFFKNWAKKSLGANIK
ncbi:MAG: type I DNA specificity S subunit, partial [SAR324 cluster bacterium]|nr:type I DNA specificity S subunit [SAR324 cluster bacterium]